MKKNVVRVLALVLVALMCLSLVPLAAHAQEHVHNYEPTRFEPTCSEDGYIQMYCEACGDGGQILEYIPPTGLHSFMNVEDPEYLIHEGDCEHAWQYWKSCSVCHQSAEEAYGKALDEMYEELNNRKNMGEEQDWETLIKNRVLLLDEKYKFSIGGEGHHYIHVDRQEATCTNDGWKEYSYCDVCGEYFNYEAIPAKGHRWGEFTQTKAPTCTEDGSRERVCEVCEVKEVEAIPALGHSWGEFTQTKAPTCTEDGSQERVCSVCGEKDVQVIPALGHRFGPFTVTKPATCTVDGEQEHVCTVCGFKETEAIPAAHKWGAFVVTEEPSCYASGTQERTCSVCGEKQRESIPAAHKFGEFVVTMEPTCYSTGEKRSTCSVCGETHVEWIDKVDHKFENGECVFCHIAMPAGYVAPSVETIETETTEPVTTENQTTEPQTTENQTTENQTTEPQTTETANEIPENAIYISFDGNGATGGSMADQAFAPGAVQALSANAFTREGYEFLGWDVAADGSAMGEERFLDGEAVELNADVTLYAQWKPLGEEVETQQVAASAESVTSLETALNVEAIDPAAMVVQNVTPLNADGTKMSNEEVAARGGVIFDMPLPETYEPGHEIEIYHQNSETGEWERVTSYTVQGDKVVIWFRHFSDFAVLDRTALGNGLTPDNNGLLGAGTGPWTVTFNGNGGSFQSGSFDADDWKNRTNEDGKTKNLPAIGDIIRAGHSLMGWNTDPNGNGKHYEPGEEYIFSDDVILYAEWDVRITYFPNGGNKGYMDSQPVPRDKDNIKLNKNLYEWVDESNVPNHTFLYWSTKEDGSDTTAYLDEDTIPAPRKDLNLYAQWAKNVVNVSFDRNGGTGSMSDITINWGEDKTLPQNQISYGDYAFLGWNTKKDGSGTDFANGATIEKYTFKNDITLYAQWSKTTFTVTYNNNTGEGTMESDKIDTATDSSLKLRKNTFTKADHEFNGWNTEANGSGTSYKDEEEIPKAKFTKNITLFAQWKSTIITVKFDANRGEGTGTGTMADKPVNTKTETSLTLEKNNFTNVNYKFIGWNTEADGSGKAYGDQATIPVKELGDGLTLYAQWEKVKFKVTFNPNTGSGTEKIQDIDKTAHSSFTLDANTYTKADNIFVGWNTKADGTGTKYTDKQVIPAADFTDDLYLYAQWMTAISFDKNAAGATGSMDPQEVDLNEETQIKKNTFKYTNYTFNGWNTKPNGSGTHYGDEADITPTTSMTLYAEWVKTSYAIKYLKGNGGGSPMADDSVEKGEAGIVKACAYKAPSLSEIFGGWLLEGSSPAEIYQPGDEIRSDDVPTDLTLIAQWAAPVTVTFAPGDGTGEEKTQTVAQNIETPLTAEEELGFTPPQDKVFDKWKVDGAETTYDDEERVTLSANIKLVAQWKAEIRTVSYDANGGSGTMEDSEINKLTETELPLRKNTFTRLLPNSSSKYYTFIGWNTEKDGSGMDFADEEKVPASLITENMTLYAQWDTAILFDGNDETGGVMEPQHFDPKAATVTINKNTFTRTNYEFKGWTGSDGETYADEMTIDTPAIPLTLKAIWEQTKYAIDYINPKDDTAKMPSQNVPKGESVELRECTFNAEPGKIFGEWNSKADGTGTAYYPGDEFTPTEDTKLYAIWRDILQVTYYPGNAEGTYKTVDTPDGSIVELAKPSKYDFTAYEGQTFAGWKIGDKVYFAGQKVVFGNQDKTEGDVVYTKERTVTAQWADAVTITYNANGGSMSPSGTKISTASDKAPKDAPYKLRTQEFLKLERDGYEFKGWGVASSSTTPVYTDGQEVIFNFDLTLYAVWEKHVFNGTVEIIGSETGGKEDKHAIVGETLTAEVKDDFYTVFDYIWLADGNPITGAENKDTYVVQESDYGKVISVMVYANQQEGVEATKSNPKMSVNTKTVQVLEDSSEVLYKEIHDNGATLSDSLPGLAKGMTYTFNSTDKSTGTLVDSNLVLVNGIYEFPFTKQGTYRFYDKNGRLACTVVVTNWYSLDYEITNRVTATTTTTSKTSSGSSSGSSSTSSTSSTTGSGTVQMKNGSTVLSASSNIKDKSGNTIIKGNGTNAWLVREGANTDLKITVRPASNSYGFVYYNGSQWFSTGYEVTKSIEPISGPEHYHIVFVNSQSSPKTADTSNLGLWSALGFVSFVGLASILVSGRKRRNRG